MPIRPDSAYRVATAYVHSETIDLVPSEIVGRVTQDFIDSGAAQVEVEPDGDGAWKIIAMFRHRP